MLSPIEVLKSLNTKKYLLNSQNARDYVPFVVNRWLSLFPDTILHTNEMNINPHLSPRMQYDYLFHSLRARSRFQKWKWEKKGEYEDLLLVSQIYKYNTKKAKEALKLLSKEQLDHLRQQQEKGGIT